MISKGIWKAVLTPYGFCILAGNIKTAVAERYFDLKPTAKELKELHDNARLIAASKKLLDSCKWINDIISTSSDGGRAWCAVREQPGAREWAEKMAEAVAEAEK